MPTTTITPTVGLGATVNFYSDRHAATVIAVSPSGKTVTVQDDKSIRADKRGMSDNQDYFYIPNENGQISVFTLRSNGRYVVQGSKMNGTSLTLGSRHEYYDFSF